MTNIAMMATWNSACGIAEYSRNLVDKFLTDKEVHNVIIFANRPDEELQQHPRRVVVPVFGVSWWGENPKIDVAKFKEGIAEFQAKFGPVDVLNIQYQSSLYEVEGFNEIVGWVNCPVVITQHDSTVNPKHKFPKHTKIVHNKSLAGTYVPFPTVEKQPRVFSFGMGRNDYELIESACKEIGVAFAGWDSRKQGWLQENTLFMAMKNADAIVLWYNEVPLTGQSAALRTAIASHRPVIVNDVGWFADAPRFVRKVKNKNELQIALAESLNLEYIITNSYTKCASKYIEIFKEQ